MQRIMSTVGQRLRKNVNWPILGRHLAQEDLPCCPTWTALIEVRPVHTSLGGGGGGGGLGGGGVAASILAFSFDH